MLAAICRIRNEVIVLPVLKYCVFSDANAEFLKNIVADNA